MKISKCLSFKIRSSKYKFLFLFAMYIFALLTLTMQLQNPIKVLNILLKLYKFIYFTKWICNESTWSTEF